MDDAAVLEPEVDLDLGADDGIAHDDGQQTEETDKGEQSTEDDRAVVEDESGRFKLSPTAKAKLDEIKTENPRLAKELRAAAFDASALRKEFPEGIREAVALKHEFEALGGKEGVETLKGENEAWRGLDKDWVSANPKIIDDLAEGNPESFAKLGPAMLSKYAEIDPDGFSGHVGRIVTSDMASYDIPLQMRLMARDLFEGGSPQLNSAGQITNVKQGMQGLAEGWAKIAGYVDRMSTLATKQGKKTEPGKQDDSQLTERERNVQQAEQRAMVQEWTGERGKIENSLLEREMKKLTAGRKLSPTQIGTIKELYEVTRDRMVNADKAGRDKVSRFAAAKDKEGYRRFISGAYGNIVPKALKAAFDRIAPTKQTARVTPATDKVKTGTKVVTTQDNTGFTRSATKPGFNEVNWQATNSIRGKKPGDGKFIMRDGSRVLYSR